MPNNPNETQTIRIGRGGTPVILKYYGTFRGETFGERHMIPENIDDVGLVHDALHSIALFLTQKDDWDIAVHNYVPFSFPNTLDYTVEYTQRFSYPLLVTESGVPVENLIRKNGCPTIWQRWCTRAYKQRIPVGVYKQFHLAGITQHKGINKFQSKKRAAYNPGRELDVVLSQKTFPIYSELPIFNMTLEEQQEIANAAGIAPNPYTIRYGAHGCMFCPFRGKDYYLALKEHDPALYARCRAWRALSQEYVPKNGIPYEYEYFPGTGIM